MDGVIESSGFLSTALKFFSNIKLLGEINKVGSRILIILEG